VFQSRQTHPSKFAHQGGTCLLLDCLLPNQSKLRLYSWSVCTRKQTAQLLRQTDKRIIMRRNKLRKYFVVLLRN